MSNSLEYENVWFHTIQRSSPEDYPEVISSQDNIVKALRQKYDLAPMDICWMRLRNTNNSAFFKQAKVGDIVIINFTRKYSDENEIIAPRFIEKIIRKFDSSVYYLIPNKKIFSAQKYSFNQFLDLLKQKKCDIPLKYNSKTRKISKKYIDEVLSVWQ